MRKSERCQSDTASNHLPAGNFQGLIHGIKALASDEGRQGENELPLAEKLLFLSGMGRPVPAIHRRKPSIFWAASLLLTLLGLVVSASGQPAAIIVSSNATFGGNNVTVDSFSSRDPNFNTGGQYDPAKVKDNGDLICNGTTANCVSVGNAVIYGHVLTGPGGTMSVGQQGAVGSHAWQLSNKGIEPNGTENQIWYDHTANLTWPDIAAPFNAGLPVGGPLDIVTGTPGNYVTNHYDHSLQFSGNYYYSGTLSGKTIVLGSATLYLPNGLAGTENFTIATNANLLLYAGGTSCSLAGGIMNQGGFATNFTLACLGSVSSISFPVASNFIGTIYAPRAAVTMNGTGNMIGSMIAGSLAVSGRVQFHYDESLGRPWFNLEPQSQSVVAGQTATFTVATLGSPPMSYQWWFNRTLLAGATNSTLIITNASTANAGTYQVVANNPYGGAQSREAQLAVNYPATIVQHPVSQAAVLNSNVAFAVTATGTAPLAWQWRFNGQSISGATNSTLTIASMQSSNIGSYTVIVTNAAGGATSDVATLGLANPPDFLWARRPINQVNGFIGISSGHDLAIDGSGNVFVAGSYSGLGGIDFGGVILSNTSTFSGATFVCKYDQWGNFVWVRPIAGTSFGDAGERVVTDSAGNVYVIGDFSGTATFGTNTLTSPPGVQQMYVAKFGGQGQALWARRIGASDPNDGADGRGLTIDATGNVFILASYSGTADFGTTNVSGTAAFLARYDTAGNLLWAKGVIPGTAVRVSQSGSIYTCGLILTKYDGAGTPIWSRPFPWALCMALDSEENIYASGMGNGTYGDLTITNVGGAPDFFLAKCNPDGNLIWSRQMGSGRQSGMRLALDPFGCVYVASISASAQPDPLLTISGTTLTNVVSLIAKYDPAGNPLWARSLGGTNRAGARGLAIRDPGAIFLAGTFYGPSQFGRFNLTAENLQGMYVTRLAGTEPPALPQIVTQPQSQKVRVGNTASFAVQTAASGIPLSYQWYFTQNNTVPGGNSNSLNLSNVQFSAAGDYSVTVANSYGSVTSSPAALTVYLTEAATLNSLAFSAGSTQVQFQIDGVPGFTYMVEASTNLLDWVSLSTNIAPAVFSDPEAGHFQQRFYRVVWMP